MILYPNRYIEKVTDIDVKFLEENSIKGLILDVDNTLIDYDKKMIDGLEQWAEELKQNNIKLCILSNSNKKDKVKKISEVLEVPYFYFAKKPFKFGFKKAKTLLNLENKNIAVVGDQIFTDVLGANRCKMYSILVKPISEKDIWITVFKRPLENKIIEKYKKSIKG
jgi:HAD superfamily phosphatase (TIGR01668 family)